MQVATKRLEHLGQAQPGFFKLGAALLSGALLKGDTGLGQWQCVHQRANALEPVQRCIQACHVALGQGSRQYLVFVVQALGQFLQHALQHRAIGLGHGAQGLDIERTLGRHAGQHLGPVFQGHRLDQQLIHTGVLAAALFIFHGVRGATHQRATRPLLLGFEAPYRRTQGITGHAGHLAIGDQHVKTLLTPALQRGLGRLQSDHLMTEELQLLRQHQAVGRQIIHHQYRQATPRR